MTKSTLIAAAILVIVVFARSDAQIPGPSSSEDRPANLPAGSQEQALLNRYCVTCHNQRSNAADLALDTKDLSNVGNDAATWESVVRKIRTGMMPPKGASRPDRSVLDDFASWLEGGLDRAAALQPNPGSPSLHRLNRNEYANAIRDLLHLEIDASTLLPADNSAEGFDNIADVLGSSPALIQGYLSAGLKVSRLAAGDLTAVPTIVTYRAPRGLSQDDHIDGLPLGTRGGMVFRHTFPLDAEYEFRIAGGQRADFTIDGQRVSTGERGVARFPVTAGPHTIGVSLVRTLDSAGVDDLFNVFGRGGGIQNVTISGPFDSAGPGDTPSRRRIFVCQPARASEELPCATEILKMLAGRAFRQPVDDGDETMETLLGFFQAGREEGDFEVGIQHALARVLVDPRFIFRFENARPDLPQGAVYRLTDLELASRLSFFLWSSIPDDALLELAIEGRLSDPQVLEQQTRRMLEDPKANALIDNFAAQWLHLRELGNAEPESRDFDGNLRQAFERETQLLFESIVREDRSIIDLLNADYTFVDERLARHYGIPNVRGSLVRRITIEEDHPRRGILGHGSVLLVTSAANRTSPVTRGQWVLENLMGSPAPSPPPGVETNLDEETGAEVVQSLRQRMERHQANPVCASCHSIMDPIGFALENFDLVGKWRDRDGDTPIDATAELVDGTRIDGPAGLRQALLERSDMFVRTATEKLLTYAVGRAVTHDDMPAVRRIVRDAGPEEYRFSSLVVGIVRSEPFQMRVKD